ncbi:MAG: PAS domain S-box protein [Bdellovibrionales bacterium]|nr:PAS domain S-box protein [Bdellovibrionales bacterium]
MSATVGIVGVATLLQWLCWGLIQPALFLFYFPAVVLASIYGDGIVAGWLSVFLAQWLFAPTVELVGLSGQSLRALVFLFSAYMIHALRRSRSRALERLLAGQLQLRHSEARTQRVLENSIDAVVAMDQSGRVIRWNSQAVAVFGYSADEAMGKRLSELIVPEEHRKAHEAGLQRYRETHASRILNQRIEIEGMRKGGDRFPVELAITPIAREAEGVSETEFYAFVRDISERKRNEARLQSAIRGRDDFISIASHELKTPLTSLKLQFQMAERQVASGDARVFLEEAVRKRIDSVNRQIGRMIRLIEDMLDVSRVSTGKLHIERKRFDLSALVREAADRFVEQFKAVGSPLEARIEDGIESFADEYRMDQVLSNLLTNAVKYGEGSPVTLGLESRPEGIRLFVEDRGPGIPPEDQTRVFERFERAVGDGHVSGLGLGLYIAKEIVEAFGGKLTLRSEVGRGSTFTVELPRAE